MAVEVVLICPPGRAASAVGVLLGGGLHLASPVGGTLVRDELAAVDRHLARAFAFLLEIVIGRPADAVELAELVDRERLLAGGDHLHVRFVRVGLFEQQQTS